MSINCPECDIPLEGTAGDLHCPQCGIELQLVPKRQDHAFETRNEPKDVIDPNRSCPMCGQDTYVRDRECRNCGETLRPADATVPIVEPLDANAVNSRFIRQFRKQCEALGVALIVLGMLAGGSVVALITNRFLDQPWLTGASGILVMHAAALIIDGAAVVTKSRAGIQMSMVLIIGVLIECVVAAVLCVPLILGAFVIVALLQAHRLLKWAGRIEAAGYPLSVHPLDVVGIDR